MLTNLSQRPDGLWRRWANFFPLDFCIFNRSTEISQNFKSIWTTIKERSDNGKENLNEWTVWICNLCLVPWSIFLSIKTKNTCASFCTCLWAPKPTKITFSKGLRHQCSILWPVIYHLWTQFFLFVCLFLMCYLVFLYIGKILGLLSSCKMRTITFS